MQYVPPEPDAAPPEGLTPNEQVMWYAMRKLGADLREEKRRGGMLVEAIQSQQQERELERAMWRDIVGLEKRQVELAEVELASARSLLAVICSLGNEYLPTMLEWVWDTANGQEKIDNRQEVDALWQLVGMCKAFARDDDSE